MAAGEHHRLQGCIWMLAGTFGPLQGGTVSSVAESGAATSGWAAPMSNAIVSGVFGAAPQTLLTSTSDVTTSPGRRVRRPPAGDPGPVTRTRPPASTSAGTGSAVIRQLTDACEVRLIDAIRFPAAPSHDMIRAASSDIWQSGSAVGAADGRGVA